MPLLGIGFFVAALVLAFLDAPRLRKGLAIVGAAWAALLIGVQAFVIGAWCKLCLVADPAAIVYAILVVAGVQQVRLSWRALAGAPALAAMVAALALWTAAPPLPELPPGTPDFVVRAQVPNAVTLVEVVDFECPFCREMHARVKDAIERAGVPVHVVRKMLPLARHPHAMPAAVAWCCADAQGKGEAMADALFTAPPESLSPEGCEQLAMNVGCDLERYRRDLPVMHTRVATEVTEVRAAGVQSLPTLYVGGERIVGASKTTEELALMLQQEHARAR
jgi:protein-disulfide isomerase